MTQVIIDDSKSMYSKHERAEIYKYVAARFLVGQFASTGVYDCHRVSAYLYNHKAKVLDPQEVGDVSEDFPEFEMQKVGESTGTMMQWHDKILFPKEEMYINNCIQWLEEAYKLTIQQ